MATAKMRALTTADVAAIIAISGEADDRQQVYKLVERIAAETCGWVLLTTLKYVEADNVVEPGVPRAMLVTDGEAVSGRRDPTYRTRPIARRSRPRR